MSYHHDQDSPAAGSGVMLSAERRRLAPKGAWIASPHHGARGAHTAGSWAHKTPLIEAPASHSESATEMKRDQPSRATPNTECGLPGG